MRYRLRCTGVTLLEVLAAIVLLSLIAVAVMPLLLRMGRTSVEIEGRIAAEAILQDELARIWLAKLPAGEGHRPLATHPGWILSWVPLAHQPSGITGSAVVMRRWVCFSVRGTDAGAYATSVLPLPAEAMP